MRDLVIDRLCEDEHWDYDFVAVVYDCLLEKPRPLAIFEGSSFTYADPNYDVRLDLEEASDLALLKIYELWTTPLTQWHYVDDRIWDLAEQIMEQKGDESPWHDHLFDSAHPRVILKETERIG